MYPYGFAENYVFLLVGISVAFKRAFENVGNSPLFAHIAVGIVFAVENVRNGLIFEINV